MLDHCFVVIYLNLRKFLLGGGGGDVIKIVLMGVLLTRRGRFSADYTAAMETSRMTGKNV